MREIKWVNMTKYKRESVCVVGEGERRGELGFGGLEISQPIIQPDLLT